MTPLFKRLDEEEAVARGELAALREKVAATEQWLARLAITRETALSLMSESSHRDEPQTQEPWAAESPAASQSASDGKGAAGEGAQTAEAPQTPGPVDLETARERMLVLLAGAGRAMKVQDIAAAIGEGTSNARRVETTRSRLKKLVKEGRAVEGPTAWFSISHADSERREESGVG
ncbi:hypothetical protein B7755_044350 [Streptomyces sp. NBS 14/10]|uniref:hypothetical protein n=1 Tax=Streptomyces sp. NBS 14/10 TaxID=1945643 RepID=UPI000B7E3D3A|nr:hypothetical protein [Streptomyces sp. NBS 14/10]KAK1184511.1 hypothetical protein B7755_044350 [Streptomyces sp. NBS 14/10]